MTAAAPAPSPDAPPTTDAPTIVAEKLSRKYGFTDALRGVSLAVRPGELLAVIGPNGAGKTTFLYLLGGLLYPTTGDVRVFGLDRWKQSFDIRLRSTMLPVWPVVGNSPTPFEYWRFLGQVYGLPEEEFLRRAERLAADMDFAPYAHRAWGKLSTGLAKKGGLIGAFLPDADLRILDEPFAGGVDPMGAETLIRWLREAAARGETIVFSTQSLDECATVATRLLLLGHGGVRFDGTIPELMARAGVDPASPRALPTAFMIVAREDGAAPADAP